MSAAPPPNMYLPDAWFIACRSDELRAGKPLARVLQGKPVVLFRGTKGIATALTDRCPHRNVPLSMGTVRAGVLECAYHGWQFDDRGTCVAVPGLVDGELALKSQCAEWWATRELDGFVWVYSTPSAQPTTEPFRFPALDDRRFTTVRRTFTVKASLHAVVENTLDVPHTGFLHGGLFRTAEKKNVIDVVIRRNATSAEAEFQGEPRPKGLIGKLLAPSGGVVEHWDRFLLPSIAQVEYRLGTASHLYSTSVMTPVSAQETRVEAVVTFRLPLFGWLVRPFVTPIAGRIFAQDAVMLERQTMLIEQFGGERYTSTEIDVLGPQVASLLKQAAAKEQGSAATHEHRVRMKT